MPALTDTDASILVTGANGFVGAWIVKRALEKGYRVRAAVRTVQKGRHLLESNKVHGDKLEIVAVGDIAKGPLDEAVKGVDAIIHTASPVTLQCDDPKELIEPAVNGAVGILSSALKNGPSVKRIVVTSSFATLLAYSTEPVTVHEGLWNEASVKDVEVNGSKAAPISKYAASKTLAEKAVWKFVEDHKSEINWDVTVINPPWIFGPVVHEVTTLDTLNASNQHFHRGLVKGDFQGTDPLKYPNRGWCDVRDVADAHIRSLEVPAAGGERLLVSNASFVYQDLLDLANSLDPKPYHTLAMGTPGTPIRFVTIDASKADRILALKYKTAEELVRDTFADYTARGW
ncbi:D-lactaldehyde dehydrogenase [Heliocybe sulcata]|uniref:D-lactaldehyde dehydrogenase n=1 Tax=Heliocybe sulcata TaxID=5364 RepID=A0A5C3MYP5_9AGAM|nr:D-lactaldehyde dehydrogenase [Heliocybe sulcata]